MHLTNNPNNYTTIGLTEVLYIYQNVRLKNNPLTATTTSCCRRAWEAVPAQRQRVVLHRWAPTAWMVVQQ